METYLKRLDQRIHFAVIPANFSNSLAFGEKGLQICPSSFLLNEGRDLVKQPVGSSRLENRSI